MVVMVSVTLGVVEGVADGVREIGVMVARPVGSGVAVRVVGTARGVADGARVEEATGVGVSAGACRRVRVAVAGVRGVGDDVLTGVGVAARAVGVAGGVVARAVGVAGARVCVAWTVAVALGVRDGDGAGVAEGDG